jgi:kynurenine formamidase
VTGRRVFDLEQPRVAGMPVHPAHRPGYAYHLHRRHADGDRAASGPRTGSSGVVVSMDHSGTHIDALCHQAEDMALFGGVPAGEVEGPNGFRRLGAEEIAPIVAPGILLDVAASLGAEEVEPGRAIGASCLRAAAADAGVSPAAGDVVLVRTGNGRHWDDPERYLAGPGMDGDAARWLAGLGVVAVGADNLAWDLPGLVDRVLGCELPGHLLLLVRAGVYIVENLALEELAAAGTRRFDFVCAPLKLVGATGAPVRPLAIVDTT